MHSLPTFPKISLIVRPDGDTRDTFSGDVVEPTPLLEIDPAILLLDDDVDPTILLLFKEDEETCKISKYKYWDFWELALQLGQDYLTYTFKKDLPFFLPF